MMPLPWGQDPPGLCPPLLGFSVPGNAELTDATPARVTGQPTRTEEEEGHQRRKCVAASRAWWLSSSKNWNANLWKVSQTSASGAFWQTNSGTTIHRATGHSCPKQICPGCYLSSSYLWLLNESAASNGYAPILSCLVSTKCWITVNWNTVFEGVCSVPD